MTKTCLNPHCTKPVEANGLCKRHNFHAKVLLSTGTSEHALVFQERFHPVVVQSYTDESTALLAGKGGFYGKGNCSLCAQPIHLRGLCKGHHKVAKALVDMGLTTWTSLVERKLATYPERHVDTPVDEGARWMSEPFAEHQDEPPGPFNRSAYQQLQRQGKA